MVSNIIVNHLNGSPANLGLTKGANLFAEQGRNDTHVVVSLTTPAGDEYIPDVRYSSVNILVVGWPAQEGSVLGDKIAKRVLAMQGNTFTYNNGEATETYNIASVTVKNWPTPYTSKDGGIAYTINIQMSYKQT